MKKEILFIAIFLGFGTLAEAQTLSKNEAKSVTNEINITLEKMDKAIEDTDWKEVQKVVDKTAEVLEKNAENVLAVFEDIDFDQLASTMDNMVIALEKNIDIEALQKRVEGVGAKIEETFNQKKNISIEIK